MTLVLTVNGAEAIWLLADRRLSRKGCAPQDDGCKVMELSATDGVALLGYAGLGATIHGTQPAHWMSRVLRGRNLPLERSLFVLAKAMEKQFPRHLLMMPRDVSRPAHNVIVPAFIGDEVRLYTIDIELTSDLKTSIRWTRRVDPPPSELRTPRLAIGGSGAKYLIEDRKWIRSLLRVVNAYDRKLVGPLTVADQLAKLNDDVYRRQNIGEKFVGPRCIVVWRNRKGGVYRGGGADQFYIKTNRDRRSAFPTIASGMDMNALFAQLRKMDDGKAPFVAPPNTPDENLR